MNEDVIRLILLAAQIPSDEVEQIIDELFAGRETIEPQDFEDYILGQCAPAEPVITSPEETESFAVLQVQAANDENACCTLAVKEPQMELFPTFDRHFIPVNASTLY